MNYKFLAWCVFWFGVCLTYTILSFGQFWTCLFYLFTTIIQAFGIYVAIYWDWKPAAKKVKRIKESAIMFEGKMYTGKRHHNCIATIVKETGKRVGAKWPQGFVTEDGEFVDRVKGGKIALAAGQIKELKYHRREMFSEDLY